MRERMSDPVPLKSSTLCSSVTIGPDAQGTESVADLLEERRFVESLSSPYNIHRLALEGYLVDPEFLAYCSFLLRRWSDPTWSIGLMYPQGLMYLDSIVNDPQFRQSAATVGFCREAKHLFDASLKYTP